MKYPTRKNQNLVFFLILLSSFAFLSSPISNSIDGSIISKQLSGEIKVVTSISIIADWVGEIGEGLFIPTSVVTGGEDPHTFELLGSDIHMIENSDLFIIFGVEGLEPWAEQVLPDNHNLNVLYLATDEMMTIDPVTSDPNPHLWMSPIITKTFVQKITNEVILLDFEHQAEYESNRDDYLSELDDLITMIDNENQFEGLKVVVHHPSFMYLLDLLGIERVGVIEEHEGSEPSAQHIGEIIDTMIAENVSIIITQPQIEEKMIIQIARDTNAKLAKLTPLLGINDISTYIDMIEYNLLALSNPEEVTGEGWIVTAIIIGSSLFIVTIACLVYFRYIKK
ncbi:MAG: zinc ABC transporter substrate-binding protein [Asgard group archaeon]|nr:zinc ABC transporter substrate-binding protein [Asgard group archaeon]